MPSEPHTLLAEFPIRVFITTNYDDFLMKALAWAGKRPKSAICPWYMSANSDFDEFFAEIPPIPSVPDEPLVFHLHGNFKVPRSLVLTESAFILPEFRSESYRRFHWQRRGALFHPQRRAQAP